jgi:formylglycine-generating enzyme required for sulfatase activity
MSRRSYTHYPRTILWLVPGGAMPADLPAVHSGGPDRAGVAPFYLSKWPITNEQLEAFDPDYRRSPLSPGDRDSAIGVTFEKAEEYCRWYAEVSRKPIRLPTEREWEYACRGGSATAYFWGNDAAGADRHAWHAGNSEGRAHAADAKVANSFGLHGMAGGVWEWTVGADGPVLRGGSFRTPADELRSDLRRPAAPDLRADDVGFRVVKPFRSG